VRINLSLSEIFCARRDGAGRIEVDGQPHNHAFTKTTTERRYAEVVLERGMPAQVTGGVYNLIVLKTTNSSFEGFVGHKGSYMENDKWCTLGETKDRLFSTAIESTWRYATPNADFNACYDKVKRAFLDKFAGDAVKGVPSPSAQQTQHDMCKEALARCAPYIQDIKVQLAPAARLAYLGAARARFSPALLHPLRHPLRHPTGTAPARYPPRRDAGTLLDAVTLCYPPRRGADTLRCLWQQITTPNLHYMPLSSQVVPEHMHAKDKDVFFPIDGPSGFIESTASLAPRSKM